MRTSNALLSVVVAVLLTAGCGGGGGGGDSGSENSAPVANAGTAQSVVTGTVVTLNGGASSDADGDTLTYSWSLTSKPPGSAASLSGATSVAPRFTADRWGNYVVTLIVNDGQTDSAPVTVTVTADIPNEAPVAVAGTAQSVVVGALVTLDGSGSWDINYDTLTYAWTLTSKPTGSAATLSGSTSVKPTFTADVTGTYVATLVVNDGKLDSSPASVVITVNPVTSFPVAVALEKVLTSTTQRDFQAVYRDSTGTPQALISQVFTTGISVDDALDSVERQVKYVWSRLNAIDGGLYLGQELANEVTGYYLSTSPFKLYGHIVLATDTTPSRTARYVIDADLPATAMPGSEGAFLHYREYTETNPPQATSNVIVRWSLESDTATTAYLCLDFSIADTFTFQTTTERDCYLIDVNGDTNGAAKFTMNFNGQTVTFLSEKRP